MAKEKAGKPVEVPKEVENLWLDVKEKMANCPSYPFISKTNLTRTRVWLQSIKRSIAEFRKATNGFVR